VACWGLSFKPRTDDMREAPAITVIERLLAAGATVRAHDPEALKEAQKIFGDRIEYSTNQYAILENADALAIITDWSEYRNPDFDRIKATLKTPLVVDGRNLYKPDRMAAAGFSYLPLGRCGGEACGVSK
jgi:UDPglucose 6-dehydrogenase